MSLEVVGHSKSKTQMILVIATVVGQICANVVQLKRAYAEALCKPNVHATAGLHGKSIGTGFRSGTGGKHAIKGMCTAEERLAENSRRMMAARPAMQVGGITRASHVTHLAEIYTRSDVGCMVAGKVPRHTPAVVERQCTIDASAL